MMIFLGFIGKPRFSFEEKTNQDTKNLFKCCLQDMLENNTGTSFHEVFTLQRLVLHTFIILSNAG